MSQGNEIADEPVGRLWSTEEADNSNSFDEDCSPTRVCRNARAFSFDGIATEEGTDLQTAWRETLERDGKLRKPTQSIRDLVLGQNATD